MHVNSILLRSSSPKCVRGHDLGTWMSCSNTGQEHVYLAGNGEMCPFCGEASRRKMEEGFKVKCLFVNSSGNLCETKSFVWMKEGPPCFMNHVGKMAIETT